MASRFMFLRRIRALQLSTFATQSALRGHSATADGIPLLGAKRTSTKVGLDRLGRE